MPRNRFGIPVVLAALLMTVGFLVALSACSSGDQTLGALEPGIVPEFPDYDQVSAIIERACVPCHQEGDDKPGYPSVSRGPLDDDDDDGDDSEQPDLSTCEGIQRNLSRVVESIHEETMPTGAWPRLEEHEKLLIDRWFLNGACSPCTEPCPEVGS